MNFHHWRIRIPHNPVSWCRVSVVLLWLVLIAFLEGCGGHSRQVLIPPTMAQMQLPNANKDLQQQLMLQGGRTSPADYKDYQVGPEDQLGIEVFGQEKLSGELRVNGQGEIRVHLLGDVPVAGLTTDEIAKKLTCLYRERDYLRDPNIKVAVKEFRHQKVAITGAVNKPDHYALIGPRTLLEVLGMAGGLSDKAGESAHIIRPQKKSSTSGSGAPAQPFSPGAETIVVDLNRLLQKGAVGLNYPVRNGDVVYIPFAQTAYVLGSVTKPGGVSLKENMTVTKAVAQTGGQHILLSSNKATVLRLDENGQRQNIPVNLAQIVKGNQEDVALKENDIVFVYESSARRFLFDFKMLLPGSVSISPAAMY